MNDQAWRSLFVRNLWQQSEGFGDRKGNARLLWKANGSREVIAH